MKIDKILIDIILITIIIITIDYIWIKNIMSKYYNNMFKDEIRLNMIGIIITYLIMVISYIIFVLRNNSEIIKNKIIISFIFGATLFGVYGFTLNGILKKYSLKIALLETIWGGILFTLTYIIYSKLVNIF